MLFFKNIFSSQTTISNCLIFFYGKKDYFERENKTNFLIEN